MDDTRTAVPALTALAERTGVAEYRLAMFGALLGPARGERDHRPVRVSR